MEITLNHIQPENDHAKQNIMATNKQKALL